MKFAEIIRNAGLNPEKFPNCAHIECRLFDGKNRLSTEESVQYVEPFFKHNEASLRNFCEFISDIKDITSIDVKVDTYTVVLFYKSTNEVTFVRSNAMNPIDYME